MKGAEASQLGSKPVLANGDLVSLTWERRALRLTNRRLKSSVVVVIAHGDIDAFNANTFTVYALRRLTRCRGLILDLRGVDFFAAEGFSVLLRVSVNCAQLGTDWAILADTAVSRLLRICDPEGSLPISDTLTGALTAFAGQRPQHPRLVAANTPTGG
jgi:anti-anti-sigma factor